MLKLDLRTTGVATGVLTSDNTNPALNDTVVVGSRTYTAKLRYALATLTSNNTNVSANDTVSIGARVYTFKAALTEDGLHAGEVVIGADANASLLNLKNAINHDAATAGTTYDTATVAHENVTAGTVDTTGHTLPITAKVEGGGVENDRTVATTATTLSFGEDVTTFANGYEPEHDEFYIAASADLTLAQLVGTINGTITGSILHDKVTAGAVDTTNHRFTITAILPGSAANTIATTETSSHLSWGASTMGGGLGGEISNLTLDTKSTYYTNKIDVSAYTELIAFLNTHAHVGDTGTLDVKFQMSPDGTAWVDSDAFTQVTTTDGLTFKRLTANFGQWLRAVITTGGTAPEYKISLSLAGK